MKTGLKQNLRVIAHKHSRDVFRVQRERSVDTTTSFARESVKPYSLVVPCSARDRATALPLPAPRVVS